MARGTNWELSMGRVRSLVEYMEDYCKEYDLVGASEGKVRAVITGDNTAVIFDWEYDERERLGENTEFTPPLRKVNLIRGPKR